ncbi:MAG: hypothetical protein A3G18_06310 [Rhodospirillales bacterium RIFCSPLOWO2_12_FULL_58_28]|nr:MAG: hypothetical protein A3H92_04125 [Rhodospirillales bacterium RIFCSPLOWO2_02_FULL_58_16]OHC76796.1 MAG: hypothetical protein A3G18_06310 [Rhodospirillales bacterium RIFCSPLOWO2_12_FULL_58_28]
MPTPPDQPKIYHIVHMDRLASIIGDGFLWSDAEMTRRTELGTSIGMLNIKQRRLTLPVDCHKDTYVGEYVPFYFCGRSVMLYLIYRGNHSELSYRDGQEPIIHMEADLHSVVAWLKGENKRWAFSLSNAGANYTQFRCDLACLGEVNWPAIAATDFRKADIKEGKQAEFLVYGSFSWQLVSRIGVHSQAVAQKVATVLRDVPHRPAVEIRPEWYY